MGRALRVRRWASTACSPISRTFPGTRRRLRRAASQGRDRPRASSRSASTSAGLLEPCRRRDGPRRGAAPRRPGSARSVVRTATAAARATSRRRPSPRRSRSPKPLGRAAKAANVTRARAAAAPGRSARTWPAVEAPAQGRRQRVAARCPIAADASALGPRDRCPPMQRDPCRRSGGGRRAGGSRVADPRPAGESARPWDEAAARSPRCGVRTREAGWREADGFGKTDETAAAVWVLVEDLPLAGGCGPGAQCPADEGRATGRIRS